ncbi:MAG: putative peptidoglycan glycosyltransferase FtsW [Anaerolineales bacterium]
MIRRTILRTDPWLMLLVSAMVVMGLVMVYSASWDVSWRLHNDPNELFRRQLTNLAYGLAVLIAALSFPIKWFRKLALPIIGFCVLALLVVLVINTGDGPRRAILGASVQPSEMAKLGLIIYLAVWMESKGPRLSEWGYGFVPLMMIIGLIGGLILLQPDLSAVMTIAVVSLTMFYLAGSRASQTLFIAAGSAIVGFVLVRLTNTGRARWDDYLAGLVDIEGASYHVQHSLQAFFSGGLIGRGLGASREKFGLLPAPHTDSIFAVLGEELGLAGALFVLLLFLAFIHRGFRVATMADDRLASLLAGGITFWIGVEAFVNMSVLLGMLPFAGNALPFFSFGGSSLLVTMAGVGLLLNVSRQAKSKPKKAYVSPTGVGRRDSRRRVSRLGRRRRPQRAG